MSSRIPDKTRQAVYERDGECCQRCGVYAYGGSIHHRVNESVGGDHRLSNLILLCGSGTTKCHGWATADNDKEATNSGWRAPSWMLEKVHEIALVRPNGTVFTIDDLGFQRIVLEEPCA